jgi:hypothetical protein
LFTITPPALRNASVTVWDCCSCINLEVITWALRGCFRSGSPMRLEVVAARAV